MSLTRERIESLAPGQASLAAALKLVKPAIWPVLAANDDASVLWSECQGSGATPYLVVVSPEDTGYKCTCPSRKFPCKHVLAVFWLRVDQPERFEITSPPQWVDEWRARRHAAGRPLGKPKPGDGTAKDVPSFKAALAAEATKPVDPKAAARADAQRQRLRAEREAAVLAGLDELDRWVPDQLAQGLAGFAQRSQTAVRTLSTRLVDAKAGGLAVRLDRLIAELFRVPEEQRADLAIERLAATTLIASAYRHQDRLSAALREDVRRTVGWSVRREELLADATAPRVATIWIVAANLSEVQPDKLRRLETWLVNAAPGEGEPRVAVLIDFVPASGGAFGFPFEPGECINGEVVFYPSPAPLRGVLATTKPADGAAWPRSPRGLGGALREVREPPWCASLARGLAAHDGWRGDPYRRQGTLAVADELGQAIPLARSQVETLTPMIGLDGLSLLCVWDGRIAQAIAADTPIGRWHGG